MDQKAAFCFHPGRLDCLALEPNHIGCPASHTRSKCASKFAAVPALRMTIRSLLGVLSTGAEIRASGAQSYAVDRVRLQVNEGAAALDAHVVSKIAQPHEITSLLHQFPSSRLQYPIEISAFHLGKRRTQRLEGGGVRGPGRRNRLVNAEVESGHGNSLDFKLRSVIKRAHPAGKLRRSGLRKVFGIEGVHPRELVEFRQVKSRGHDIRQRRACRLQDRLDILNRLADTGGLANRRSNCCRPKRCERTGMAGRRNTESAPPTLTKAGAASRGNVVLFCGRGSHARTRGLPGGGRWIRTRDISCRTASSTKSETPVRSRPSRPTLTTAIASHGPSGL
jgi:hypothetical protein